MKPLLILALGAALAVAACGTTASDATDTSLNSENGAAGTGVVLATKGREVRLGPGADVTTQLTAPLTVRVRMS